MGTVCAGKEWKEMEVSVHGCDCAGNVSTCTACHRLPSMHMCELVWEVHLCCVSCGDWAGAGLLCVCVGFRARVSVGVCVQRGRVQMLPGVL